MQALSDALQGHLTHFINGCRFTWECKVEPHDVNGAPGPSTQTEANCFAARNCCQQGFCLAAVTKTSKVLGIWGLSVGWSAEGQAAGDRTHLDEGC